MEENDFHYFSPNIKAIEQEEVEIHSKFNSSFLQSKSTKKRKTKPKGILETNKRTKIETRKDAKENGNSMKSSWIETEKEWECYLDGIKPNNHLPSLYSLNDSEQEKYKELIKLRNEIRSLSPTYRLIFYEEKGLELLTLSKCNQLSQIDWRTCSNYFFTCLTILEPILFQNFMKESKFQNLSKNRINIFYKLIYYSCNNNNNDNNNKKCLKIKQQQQFEIAIACVKWYSTITQLSSYAQIEQYVKYLFFDIWFIHLYRSSKVDFFHSETKKHLLSGIIKHHDPICKSSILKYEKTLFDKSGLCIEIDEDYYYMRILPWFATSEETHQYSFGIYTKEVEFICFTIPSIPNTQKVLNEFFKNDIFFQDLMTTELERKLYTLLKELPREICFLIVQYLRSIFFQVKKQTPSTSKLQDKNQKLKIISALHR